MIPIFEMLWTRFNWLVTIRFLFLFVILKSSRFTVDEIRETCLDNEDWAQGEASLLLVYFL